MSVVPFNRATSLTGDGQEKKVVISDFEGTLTHSGFQLNLVLLKFLALAQEKGHTVIVTTRRGVILSDLAMDGIKLSLFSAGRKLGADFSGVVSCFKDEVREKVKESGAGSPFIVFEDDLFQLEGPGAYACPSFVEHVTGPGETGRMRLFARELGFLQEFVAYLEQSRPGPVARP